MQSKRDILNSARIKQQRRKLLKKRMMLGFVFFIILIVALSFLSKNRNLTIHDIRVEGNHVVETQSIIDVAEARMAGNYLHLFSRANAALYPNTRMKNDLFADFSRISAVDISLVNLKTLSIKITERKPEYLWCGIDIPATDAASFQNTCYFLDDAGYIFDQAPYFSGNIYFKFYGWPHGSPPDDFSGNHFLPADDFEKLVYVKNSLANLNLKPDMFKVSADGDYEIYLEDPTGKSDARPKIVFNKGNDFEKIINNLSSALNSEPLQTDFKNKFVSLLYIDLRYDNKVYYKFK